MIELNDIFLAILTIGVSALGWWMKQISNAVRINTEMNLKQQGELAALERLNDNKLDSLREMTELQISTLAKTVEKLANTIEKHIELTEKRLNK